MIIMEILIAKVVFYEEFFEENPVKAWILFFGLFTNGLVVLAIGFLMIFHGILKCKGWTTFEYIMRGRQAVTRVAPKPEMTSEKVCQDTLNTIQGGRMFAFNGHRDEDE